MARIPILQPGANLVNTGTRTARVASLTADTSGETWGKVAQQAGDLISGIAIERRKANDAVAMIEIEGGLRDLTAQQMQFQNDNPDQERWGEKWQELTTTFEKNTLAKADLSQKARLAMSDTFTRYTQGQSLSIQEAANRQAKQRANTAFETRMRIEEQAGNVEGARQVAKVWTQSGTATPEDVGLRLNQAEQNAQATHKQNTARNYRALRNDAIVNNDWQTVAALDAEAAEQGVIEPGEKQALDGEVVRGQLSFDILSVGDKDPKQAMQMLEASNLPRNDKALLQRDLENKVVQFERGEMQSIADSVAMGAIKRGSDIKFNYITSPAEQADIRAKVDALPPSAEQLVGETLDLRAQVADFNVYGYNSGDKPAMMKAVEINARISKLPPGQREDITKLWDKARAGQMSVKDSFVAEGGRIVNEIYKAEEEKFFTKGLMGGKGTLKKGQEKAYADFKLRITKMENDLKQQIPENATPEKAAEIIQQVTGASATEVRRTPYLTPQSGFAPVPGNGGTVPDLPGASGSLGFPMIDTSLFPPVTP